MRGFLGRALVAGSAIGTLAVPLLAPVPLVGSSPAMAQSSTVYVSPSGAPGKSGASCGTAQYASVQDGVDAAPTGGRVIVCAGTYHEGVTITRRVTLVGQPGSTIDAEGQPYGIGVGASYSQVMNLTVQHATASDEGAPGDGIVTVALGEQGPVPADHLTITGNNTNHNDGAGIDVNSSSFNVVQGNDSQWNGIGVNVSDDFGLPASHNVIQRNVASNNPGGCGIVLADHSGAGIFANVVAANVADNNGLGTPSAPDASSGSGIILAGGAGGIYDNQVVGNTFDGNGHAGVALHGHAPGMDFSGNVISGNSIGTNNLRQDFADPETTGIYLGDASPLTIVVSGNQIHDNHFGIFTAGHVTVIGHDSLTRVTVARGSTPNY